MNFEWHLYRQRLRETFLFTFKSMMLVSFFYCIFYFPIIPWSGYPLAILIAFVYGLFMGFGYWLSYVIGWGLVCLWRAYRRPSYTPGLVFDLIIACIGVTLGVFPGEYLKSYLFQKPITADQIPFYILSGCILGIGATFFLYFRQYKAKYERIQTSTIEAQYNTLKAQTNPHFLFNSLNSLSELIISDSKSASEVTQKLADLYREILTNSKHKTCSLKSEMSIARKYLELEKIRFGPRLHFELDEPENSENIYVPSLIVQTLVENAVKHGISKSVDGGKVCVVIRSTASDLYRVEVSNTGAPFTEGQPGSGTGLANTKERLKLIYGEMSDFKIECQKDLGTLVTFQLSGNHFV